MIYKSAIERLKGVRHSGKKNFYKVLKNIIKMCEIKKHCKRLFYAIKIQVIYNLSK
jgi:hypothetical protein